MGLFLQTAIIKKGSEENVREVLSKVRQENARFELNIGECKFREENGGVVILYNDDCECSYDKIAKAISERVDSPVMQLFIYDDDFWGYYLYQNGKELDSFMPMLDYFGDIGDIPEEELRKFAGNPSVVAKAFEAEETAIKGYLKSWTAEMFGEHDKKAYEDDEFGQCDCWQMADFMRSLGYPYEW